MNYALLYALSFLLNTHKKALHSKILLLGNPYTTEGTVIHRTPSISHGKNLRSAIPFGFKQLATPFLRRRKEDRCFLFSPATYKNTHKNLYITAAGQKECLNEGEEGQMLPFPKGKLADLLITFPVHKSHFF